MSVRKHLVAKPQYHRLPFDALEEVAKVLAMGAEKYGERAWETGIPYSESISALMRHQKLFFQDRKDYDVESGLLHTAHMACNILFILAGQVRELEGIDDRPSGRPEAQEVGRTHFRSCFMEDRQSDHDHPKKESESYDDSN